MNLKKYFLITILITTFSGLHCKITDVAIFLHDQHGEETFTTTIKDKKIKISYRSEEERFLKAFIEYIKDKQPISAKSTGPVLKALIQAIEQDVKIIIVSEPLTRCLIYFLKNFNPEASKVVMDEYKEKGKRELMKIGALEILNVDVSERKRKAEEYLRNIEEEEKYSPFEDNTVKNFFNSIGTKWSVYKNTKKSKNFAIFIRDPKPNLEELGLNKKLKKINKKDFIKIFSESDSNLKKFLKKLTPSEINIKELVDIFQGDVPKIVYITGHGDQAPSKIYKSSSTGKKLKVPLYFEATATIANLYYNQNVKLIEKLNTSGCLFLAYTSCYSGGQTLLFLNKKINFITRKIKQIPINFPILVTGFSDNPSTNVERIEIAKFYQDIHSFFEKRPPLKDIEFWSTRPFRTIAKHIAGTQLENTPSIVFPGLQQPLRTIEIDKQILAITYPFLIKHELKGVKIAGKTLAELSEYKKKAQEDPEKLLSKKRIKPEKIEIEKKPINISDMIAVALYPMILEVPLKIEKKESKNVPALVSMIPGPANHFIKNIDASGISFDRLIKEMFGTLKLKSNKFFYFHKLTCNNYKNSGISYPKNPQEEDPNKPLEIELLSLRLSPKKLDISFSLKAKVMGNEIIVPAFKGTYTFATKKLEINFEYVKKFTRKPGELINEKELRKQFEDLYANAVKTLAQDMQPINEAFEIAGIVETKKQFENRLKRSMVNYSIELNRTIRQP
ncbi:hypothetical protein ACFLYA_01575 [Candidatus Dependentiae bacterium]